ELAFPKNFVAMPGRAGEQPKIEDSEVVFVGHGVVAPEYGWDDFKGLDGPAGYPFSVVQGSWSGENFDIVASGSAAPALALPVKGWIDSPTAKVLCLAAGQDLAALKSSAVRRDFRPVALNARARFDIEVKARQVQ